jgi:hypothetical protein
VGFHVEMTAVAPTPVANRLRSALERNVFLVTVLGVCAALQAVFLRAAVVSDSWYTLLGGRIVAHDGLPNRDTLTVFTLGRHWVDQQWLAHLVLYGVWAAGGWQLAGVVLMVLYVGAFAIAGATARLLGASDRSTAVAVVAGFLTGVTNTVFRAQIPAYVLFAVVFGLLLTDARRPSQRVYLVLPLLVLWANLHGSVVLGASLVALRGVLYLRARAGRAAALIVLPWVCVLVSPYAARLPGYYKSVLDNSTLSHSISEWGPSTLRGQPIFFVLLLVSFLLIGRAGSALPAFDRLAIAALGVLGLVAVRNDVWFALAAAAVIPLALDTAWAAGDAPRRRSVNLAVACAGIGVGVVSVLAVASHSRGWFERDYPTAAVAAVAAAADSNPAIRVFADERYADWLLFRDSALKGRVAYDDRFELLSKPALSAVVDFRNEHGPGWQNAAVGYDLLVLDPAGDAGAVSYFRGLGLRVLYGDGKVVVLTRRAPRR